MDEEFKKLLLENIQLTRENHTMLKKLRRAQKNAKMMKMIYWVIIIALAYMAYVKVRPLIQQASDTYNAAQQQLDSIKNFGQ
ncbi:MAG TPA: hypothetical protein PK950_01100 [Candidatus Paceibacterota bacterium]|nr:hypothetical protein [Candidatus Paceibacterota bacterium]